MTSITENMYFLFNTFCIFISETVFLFFHQNRQKFVKRLAIKLSKKNILYVKLFQAIALNRNLIDDEINNELMKFTDTAPYDNNDIDSNLLNNVKDEYNLMINIYIKNRYKPSIDQWNQLIKKNSNRVGAMYNVIDLFSLLNNPNDFIYSIEPSEQGSVKIAAIIFVTT
jgi:hypothetical protein